MNNNSQDYRFRDSPFFYTEFMKATAPLQRVGEGSEIATACLFFSTDDSSFITGQLLRVDGGVDA